MKKRYIVYILLVCLAAVSHAVYGALWDIPNRRLTGFILVVYIIPIIINKIYKTKN